MPTLGPTTDSPEEARTAPQRAIQASITHENVDSTLIDAAGPVNDPASGGAGVGFQGNTNEQIWVAREFWEI
jgi:hypothetical protein